MSLSKIVIPYAFFCSNEGVFCFQSVYGVSEVALKLVDYGFAL